MKPVCLMPWHALTLAGNGDIKPCCQLRGPHPNVHFGGSLSEGLRSEKLMRLRKDLLTGGLPESCSSCWQREASIGESRRTWFSNKFSQALPKDIDYTVELEAPLVQADLSLSNFCNLKCRMCGSWGSHQWNAEDRALAQISSDFKRESRPERLKLFETEVEQLKSILPRLQNAQRLDFKGGEPMLAKTHPDLLRLLIESGLNHKLNLTYTSNGTVMNEQILNLLSQFRSVTIIFSIEAIGSLYQFIRGGRYEVEDLIKNITAYDHLENISIGFNVATQIYNVTRLRELCDFLFSLNLRHGSAKDAFKYTVVNDPNYLSPFILPEALREAALMSIQGEPELEHIYKKLAATSFDPIIWQTFKNFTNSLDQIRKESVLEVLPEFSQYWD
jgi:sulfatase maturation enzyme AslB (radical SAM superfamily)